MFKLFRYLRPYTSYVAATLILIFAHAMADLSLPTLMSDIVDKGIARNDLALIARTGGWMLLLALAGAAANIASGYTAARAALGFGRDLRSRVFARVSGFSLREMDKFGAASLITRTTNDITQVQQVLVMMLRMMVMSPMMAAGGIFMAVTKEPSLAWILLVALPVIAGTIILVARKGLPMFKKIQLKLDNLNRILRENLSGIRVIRAFDRDDYERRRFDGANSDLTDISLRVSRFMAALFPLLDLIMNLTIILIVWVGGFAVARQDVRIGSLMAFIQYASRIMFSILMLSMIIIQIPRAAVSSERINEVLDTEPEIRDPEEPVPLEDTGGRVEFRGVTFRYPGAQEPALRDISFTAESGRTTAIIGGTGSGKSTVVHLIERFYDVDSGAVVVDGVDVRRMSQEDLRSRIGLATQKAVLFSGSIGENLRFGSPDAADADLERAADIAQASSFIREKEGGFGAPISQGGTNVSGGQKQRLAIARALVRKPKIFLFDDTFSALDFKTDARLRAALRRETENATVLIVAQRVATIRDADRIVVLDEGRIAGMGTHEDLIRDCPVYREIADSQYAREETA